MPFAARIIGLVSFVLMFSFSVGHASETVKGAKKDYQSFKNEMSAKLDSAELKLKELRAKAALKRDSTQDAAIAELEMTQAKLKSDLAEVKEAGKSNWSKFKAGFASSVDNLNTKIQHAVKD